jgi:hypothetical protein
MTDVFCTADILQLFEERRRQKYDKVIAGGALLGSKGLDEGVDRKATRSP